MKFLENEKLAQLTALMTDAIVGTGERVINGRVEAFTMKRAGTDKKLAHELGEKYQAEIEVVETELAQQLQTLERKRSDSIGNSTNGSGGSNRSGRGGRGRNRSRKSSFSSQSLPPLASSHSPSNKRVRIDTTLNNTGRRRRRSQSLSESTLMPSSSSKSPMKSALRTRKRSESFDVKATSRSSNLRSRSDSFISNSSPLFTNSPLGDFHDSSAQRLMTDLILTLNASFPDYDFSSIRPSHIARLPSLNVAINRTNEKLAELTTSTCTSTSNMNIHGQGRGANFFSQLWNAIDDVIGMNDSEVYSYVPPHRDDDDDPLGFLKTLDNNNGGGDSDNIVPLWTLNFFFVNKSMKRIVLFTCVQTMRSDISSNGNEDDDDDGINFTGGGVRDIFSYDNYGMTHPGFRSSRDNSAMEDNLDEDDEDNDWKDFDMDADTLGQPAPPTTVA
mmetsp:Transcript_14552/g.18387  ORF Transcript_14552/g.18387 Transcript_14552/m.18387 type:complete len:445 (+) Transcript_14552:247-1581(+)